MRMESTEDIFQLHRLIWKFAGCASPKKNRILYFIWTFVFNFGIITLYPMHLIIGLFQADSKGDLFKNLLITVMSVQCCFKFIIICSNIKNMRLIESIFSTLDKRIQTKDEHVHFQKIARSCKNILYVFMAIYISGLASLPITSADGGERQLLYPGWLPIDWKNSATKYWIACSYQFIGVSLMIPINYANDTYPSVSLAALSGHVRLLVIRVSKLGTDPARSQADNNKELRMCIKDHKRLIEIYYILNKVLSKGMFCQLLGTGLTMCCSVICLIFFTDSVFAGMYYSVIFVLMPLEIFPTCYFGSAFETEFNSLPYALFGCNWLEQDKSFTQNMIVFSERSVQTTSFLSMGIFRIHLDTFFVTMKSAYSLLAVIIKLK